MEFLAEYGLFLLKTATVVVGLVLVLSALFAFGQKGSKADQGHIEVRNLNERLDDMALAMREVILEPAEHKHHQKSQKKADKKKHSETKKAVKKSGDEGLPEGKPRVYVLDFDGDIRASAVSKLREEISAVLTMARESDEIVVKIESGGGMVHGYGLAASQLDRIRAKGIPLTICIDKVAASGGYMMACIGQKIIAAPFAMVGSIGVVAQLPNFNRLLKKHDVDFEMLTAGEYKRTLTMFGENTEQGRQKFVEELEETHHLFKQFVAEHREQVDIEAVATGEVWFGSRALELNLVDALGTSDQYLMDQQESADIYAVRFVERKTLQEKLGMAAEGAVSRSVENVFSVIRESRFFS